MPSKYVISAALNEQSYNSVVALANAKGLSLSKTLATLLNDVSPQLLHVAQAIELAKSHIEHNDNKLYDHIEQMLNQAALDFDNAQNAVKGLQGVKNES
jgi:gas vesicle protein